MRKLFLVVVLVLSGFVNAQSYVNPDLQVFVDYFIETMEETGNVDMTGIVEKDFIVAFDEDLAVMFEQEFKLEDKILGKALGMFENDFVLVAINKENFDKLELHEKLDLIVHELMHDVFNYEHTHEAFEGLLMHPSSMALSLDDAFRRAQDAARFVGAGGLVSDNQ